MKEMDLMYALTDVDEKFLNREPAKKVKTPRISRVAALAAVIALVTISVCSAMLGIEYWFGHDGDGYYTIDYRYPMEPVEIHQQAYEDLADALVENLLYYQNGIEQGDFPKPDTQGLSYSDGLDRAWLYSLGLELDCLEEVEAYLGLTLNVSPEIREAVNSSFQFRSDSNLPVFVMAYGPCFDEAASEYKSTGSITPQGVGIQFHFLDGEENNWYAGLRVYIPLSTQFAEEFQPDTWYSPEGNGPYRTREYSNGSQDFLIAKLEYTEEYGDTCLAMYADGGVGYELYCCAWPTDFAKSKIGDQLLASILGTWDFDGNVCKNSEKIILSLIENIE